MKRGLMLLLFSILALMSLYCVQLAWAKDSFQVKSKKNVRTLRQAYKNYFPVGAAVYTGYLNTEARAKFVAEQYSSVTPEDQMKPFAIQPLENKFNWTQMDKLVDFAQKNNMKVRGHCLIWFHRMPKWFFLDGQRPASRELILKRMKKHITAVMQRYKGKIYCYDVVNEVVTWRSGRFFKAEDTLCHLVGEDYIEKAFEYARAADPGAKLFYNEIWFKKEKRDQLAAWLKNMKKKGVPVDGIGLQGHFQINGTSEEYLQETIDLYHSIGLDVQITELDISIYKGINPKDVVNESEEYSMETQKKQAAMFEMIFRVCRKNKGKVTGVTFWAPSDGENFLTKWLGKPNYPYLFDRSFTPKESFFRVTEF